MVRIVTRFTKLREEGITVKKPGKKKQKIRRRRKTYQRILARCRDCGYLSRVTRKELFDRASPPRCTECGGMLDTTKNMIPKHKGLLAPARHTRPKPKPVDTSRNAGRST